MNNNEIALEIIKKSHNGLTAYEVLGKFNIRKKVQPMTVYRSLKKLEELGKIHKSNHNKKYILCNHSHNKKHNTNIALCKKCGDTKELKCGIFYSILKKYVSKKFNFNTYDLEITTTCRECN
jgi:Fur family zinc uptake transcriptional regulator|tara:strand:+ start:98 stop:463 length:366 start_codon:yes stop_codon:yes gene_type:complete